jgi:hypothetical protein
MARRRKKHPAFRELDGILLLDKPRGMSSNAVLQVVRRLYAAEKGGHTGALDPLATGLLPLCFGEATKIAGLLLSERKAYEVLARFGIETDTCDADGVVVAERPLPALSVSGVVEALAPFVGRIRQIPPIYSALKLEGEPLYLKARRGESGRDLGARGRRAADHRTARTGDRFGSSPDRMRLGHLYPQHCARPRHGLGLRRACRGTAANSGSSPSAHRSMHHVGRTGSRWRPRAARRWTRSCSRSKPVLGGLRDFPARPGSGPASSARARCLPWQD